MTYSALAKVSLPRPNFHCQRRYGQTFAAILNAGPIYTMDLKQANQDVGLYSSILYHKTNDMHLRMY